MPLPRVYIKQRPQKTGLIRHIAENAANKIQRPEQFVGALFMVWGGCKIYFSQPSFLA